ncbi:MAG: hypothetical protein J5679_00335 [Alphaproteobacteria bacterium]|nr:hypothetical protein [Alphaproteobacteria bacterium]
MKTIIKKMIMLTSILGVSIVLSGCSSCPSKQPAHHSMHKQEMQHRKYQKQQVQSAPQITETVVFYQSYENDDIDSVSAKMYTHSSKGGESKMGTIKFVETNDGLHMKINLIDLRPGKTYTAHIYPCGACNDYTCCTTTPMAIDLPTLKIEEAGRLETSYIIRGLTAAQINNAKIVLTRDGGYKAAWGKLK